MRTYRIHARSFFRLAIQQKCGIIETRDEGMTEMRYTIKDEGPGFADVGVKVLRGNGTGDIVDQYVRFCKISDEERKEHERSRKAIEETLRRCMEENVLAPFLATRQKEVAEIMVTLFDQEKIMEIHDYHVAEDARKDEVQEGIAEGTLGSIHSLMKNLGMTIEQALAAIDVPEADYLRYISLLQKQ